MTGFWITIGIGVIILLAFFIVLQRRKPDEADKVSNALDSAWKAAKDKAENAIKGDKKP